MEYLSLAVAGALLPPPKVKKDRKEYFSEYNNRPEIKEKRKLARLERERQKEERENEANGGYSKAEDYRVLMSLKEYTELNQEKKKNWLNFIWTFKELNETGFSDIIQIMKIREEAENLINDYWETAKNEIKKGKSWNSLNQEQQDRLIKYWGREKARKENSLSEALSKQESEGKKWEKDIEIAKYHEERGKIKCECWSCEEQKKLQAEAKTERKKIFADYEKGQDQEKEKCLECGQKVKELDEENELCKKCMEAYEGDL